MPTTFHLTEGLRGDRGPSHLHRARRPQRGRLASPGPALAAAGGGW
jgi:hypothetical protein